MTLHQRAAVLASSGAVLASCSVIFSRRIPPLAGLPADFWRGVPLGLSIVLILTALVMLARANQHRG